MEELKSKLFAAMEGLNPNHLTEDQKKESYYRLVSYVNGYTEGKWGDRGEGTSKFLEAMEFANDLFDIYVPGVLATLEKSAKAKRVGERTVRRRGKK